MKVKKELAGIRNRQQYQGAASLVRVERYEETPGFTQKGTRAIIICADYREGRSIKSPAFQWARTIRRRMRPIRVPNAMVFNAEGTPIAEIKTDPVTGERKRVPL